MSNNRSRLVIAVVAILLLVGLSAAGTLSQGERRQPSPALREGLGEGVAAAAGLLPNYSLLTTISFEDNPYLIEAVADPARDRLYVVSNAYESTAPEPTLFAIDTRQGRVVHSAALPHLWHLRLSRDGALLYGFDSGAPPTMHIYDAARLTFLRSLPLTCPPPHAICDAYDLAIGPEERLYWLDSANSTVNVTDMTTGANLHQLQLATDFPVKEIEIAGQSLFVTRYGTWAPYQWTIARYNIAEITPVWEFQMPITYDTSGWQVSPDGTFLLAGGSGLLQQFSAQSLSVARSYDPGAWNYIGSTTISAGSDRIIYALRNLNENVYFRGFNAASGELEITGMVDMHGYCLYSSHAQILALADDGVALVFPDFVYLYSATSHAAAVPVVFANHCPGGAIFDDFSDANSGWPSAITDDIVYGYADNQYVIALGQADRWFAVSRGDKWIDGHKAAIATRVLAGEGLSGLVFGLNDDWSHFYTFEVIPDLGRWALFEFRADVGWTLLQTGLPGNIAHDDWNRLMLRRWDDRIELHVNGTPVGITPNRPGRIAISGGSFAPSFEARYHNYEFVGQNCGSPYRAGEMDFAPPISRPPVEEFLIGEQ